MEREFVPYDRAFELKGLGFNEPCFGYYDANGKLVYNYREEHESVFYISCVAPIYQQAFRWFRDYHGIIAEIGINYYDPNRKYGFCIYNLNEKSEAERDAYYYNTYEYAEYECLGRLIEIIKNK